MNISKNESVIVRPMKNVVAPQWNGVVETRTKFTQEMQRLKGRQLVLLQALSSFAGSPVHFNDLQRVERHAHFLQLETIHMSYETAIKITQVMVKCLDEHGDGTWVISRKDINLPVKIIFKKYTDSCDFFLLGSKKTHPVVKGGFKIGRIALYCKQVQARAWSVQEVWHLSQKKTTTLFSDSREIENIFYNDPTLQHALPKKILDYDHLNPKKRGCFYEKHVSLSLRIRNQITYRQIFYIATQLAADYAIFHENRYILGDIKLANILVTATDKVFLCDLDTITQDPSKVVIGTRGYMAPERFSDNTSTLEVLQQADVFAFGCVLYKLAITRRLPWDHCTNGMIDYDLRHCQAMAEGALEYLQTPEAIKDTCKKEIFFIRQLAWACVHPIGARRPSMEKILELLLKK